MKESFELNESENEKIENLLSHIETRTLQLRNFFWIVNIWISHEHHIKTYKSELKIAMKKITILQNELQADIKTIEIDETACWTIISCQIKTQDQVIFLAQSYKYSQ